jgi:hypothetical protein
MILEHRGARPTIDPAAYVAPTAVVSGDVLVPHAHVNGCEVAVHRELDFPDTVYVVPRETPPEELMRCQSECFGAHREDRECG